MSIHLNRKLAITLLFSLALLLALAGPSSANASPHRRDHFDLNRMIKKRAAAPSVDTSTPTPTPSTAPSSPSPSVAPQPSVAVSSAQPSPSPATSASVPPVSWFPFPSRSSEILILVFYATNRPSPLRLLRPRARRALLLLPPL